MGSQKILKGSERTELLNALYAKYGEKPGWRQRWTYWRKKYFWLIVVTGAKLLKRFLDISVSLAVLIVLTPFLLLIALLIKLQDGGPVFYVSSRVGKWGRPFSFYKFRSMRKDAEQLKDSLLAYNEEKDAVTFKIRKDPRITSLGQFLRKTSLDEIPQLWNVLHGDMSLVGPRPHLPREVDLYTLEERRRLDVAPGITGIWQVSGRSDIPFTKQVQLDLQYIESQSVLLDFLLLLKTIPAVLFGKGAY